MGKQGDTFAASDCHGYCDRYTDAASTLAHRRTDYYAQRHRLGDADGYRNAYDHAFAHRYTGSLCWFGD